ncbi:hypothetical protein D3C84_809260 [compost metagenome]
MFPGQGFHFFVVEGFGFRVQAIGKCPVDLAGKIHRGAVGQVAAMGQGHAQDGVAGFKYRQENRLVGLGTGVRLHVDVFAVEQLASAFDGQVLDFIDDLAAAVVTLARIAFGVFVGEHGTLGLEHLLADIVFRSDQLQVGFLAVALAVDQAGNGGVEIVQAHGLIPWVSASASGAVT